MSPRRTVGVLGGLGPAATADFLAKLTAATPATVDQDHLHVLVDSDPTVPDRNAAIAGTGPSPGPALARMASRLEGAGAEFLVIACNTAHHWREDIESAVGIPLVDLIAATRDEVLARAPGVRCVGILAGGGCVAAGLYQRVFEDAGIEAVTQTSEDLEAFMGLLYGIKAGHDLDPIRAEMTAMAARLVGAGAEVLLAGCTEVPLVLTEEAAGVPLVSSTDVLVAETVRHGLGEPWPAG